LTDDYDQVGSGWSESQLESRSQKMTDTDQVGFGWSESQLESSSSKMTDDNGQVVLDGQKVS
jgi:hypothetical protein